MFGLGCECRKRAYRCKWSWDQAAAFLKRKNIYDTFEYVLEDGESLFIIFKNSKVHPGGNLNSKYTIALVSEGDCTVFRIDFVEELLISICLSDVWLDEFFLQKLDAIPVQGEFG